MSKVSPPFFDEWLKIKGINPDKQYTSLAPTLMVFEGLYDLILDLQLRVKDLEK